MLALRKRGPSMCPSRSLASRTKNLCIGASDPKASGKKRSTRNRSQTQLFIHHVKFFLVLPPFLKRTILIRGVNRDNLFIGIAIKHHCLAVGVNHVMVSLVGNEVPRECLLPVVFMCRIASSGVGEFMVRNQSMLRTEQSRVFVMAFVYRSQNNACNPLVATSDSLLPKRPTSRLWSIA